MNAGKIGLIVMIWLLSIAIMMALLANTDKDGKKHLQSKYPDSKTRRIVIGLNMIIFAPCALTYWFTVRIIIPAIKKLANGLGM